MPSYKLTAIHQPSLDPKGAAGKLKPQLQLIPPISNVETAKALKHGADRYGPWNWRTANVESMTYIGAIKRHLDAYLDGQDLDESGAHHLGHIAASCAILLDAAKFGTLVDNRPPKMGANDPQIVKDEIGNVAAIITSNPAIVQPKPCHRCGAPSAPNLFRRCERCNQHDIELANEIATKGVDSK